MHFSSVLANDVTCWTAQGQIILRFQWRSSSQVQIQIKGESISVIGKCTSIVQGIFKLQCKSKKNSGSRL